MFTQQAPFLLSALSNVVGSGTAQQLAQAFGNCNQPLSHRAGVSLQRAGLATNAGVLRGPGGNPYDYTDGAFGFLAGNDPATQFSPWAFDRGNFYGGDTFNTSAQFAFRSGDQFLATYPAAASNAFYNLSQKFEFGPISSVNNSPWFTRMGDVNTFDFSSRLGDIVNNFAGPTFQVAGDSYFDNSVHNNMTAANQSVGNQEVEDATIINLTVENLEISTGDPAAGGVGADGAPGRPGDPGRVAAFLGVGGYDLPAIRVVGRPLNPPRPVVPEGRVEWPAGNAKVQIPTYKLQGKGEVQAVQTYTVGGALSVDLTTYTLTAGTVSGTVPKYKLPTTLKVKFPAVEFDAENCTVSYSDEDTVELDLEVTDAALASDGTDSLSFTGTPPSLSPAVAPAAIAIGDLTVVAGAAAPLEVTLAGVTVVEAVAKKDIPLPVPAFKGQILPTLDLGPQNLNLVPKPRYP
jgi:hypothetical protein